MPPPELRPDLGNSGMKSGRERGGNLGQRKPYNNLATLRFGNLTATSECLPPTSRKNGNIYWRWVCICDCGKQVIVRSSNLTSGHTQSCGKHNQGQFKPKVQYKYFKKAESYHQPI